MRSEKCGNHRKMRIEKRELRSGKRERAVLLKNGISHFSFLTSLFLCLFLIFLTPVSVVGAQKPAVLNDFTDKYPLGHHIAYLEDKAGQWSVNDVASDEFSEKFVESGSQVQNFGYTDSVYWIRLTLDYQNELKTRFTDEQNKLDDFKPGRFTTEKKEWFLEEHYPLLDDVECWFPVHNGKQEWQKRFVLSRGGDMLPFRHRDIRHHHFVFRVNMRHGTPQTLYFRIRTAGTMEFSFTLWSPAAFAEKVTAEQFVSGIYYGIMLAMACYNFFLFVSIRDRSYLFYILYIISYTLFQLSLSGEGYQYLWSELPWWFNRSIPFFIAFTGLWIAQFTRAFLKTEIAMPRMDSLLNIFSTAAAASAVFSLILSSYSLSVKIAVICIMPLVGAVLLTGLFCLKTGHRVAKYFMIAWCCFGIGAIFYALKSFGILPSNLLTAYVMQIGSAMLVILLGLGLADRINAERKEKLAAYEKILKVRHEAFAAQEEATQMMEEIVEERTGELRASLEQVEYANKHILENIRYAERIQRSLLPSEAAINRCLKHCFIIDEPKYIVGGDIYFFEEFPEGWLMALIDCTGHGIPGALMTMLAGTAFKEIIQKDYYNDPSQILKSLNAAVKTSLYSSDEKTAGSDDGMDAGIVFMNVKTGILTFAGAKTALAYTSSGDTLRIIRGDRHSIGYKDANPDFNFSNHQIPIQEGMSFYMATDGITDQPGGPGHLPFGNKRFRSLLKEMREKSFDEQKRLIREAYMAWKGDEEQRDDMTVIGFGF